MTCREFKDELVQKSQISGIDEYHINHEQF